MYTNKNSINYKRKKLTQKRLKELLHYDYKSGVFTWVKATSYRTKVGDIAGYREERGYIRISIDGYLYLAHRLAILYIKGYLPEYGVDHIDRVCHHNWSKNLREATQQCNSRNKSLPKNNKSKVIGVCTYYKGQWRANIGVDYKYYHLGCFKNKSDAVKARWAAEKKYDFPNCNTTSTAYLYLKRNNLL